MLRAWESVAGWRWPLAKPAPWTQAGQRPLLKALLPISLGLVLLGVPSAGSQSQPESPGRLPTDVRHLLRARPPVPLVTAATPSAEEITVPSLWWADQQFGQRLVMDWRAYPANDRVQRQIHVIVKPELWATYSYVDRYSFVTRFGTIASDQGYHLLILTPQNRPLGAYTCAFGQLAPHLSPEQPEPQGQTNLATAPLACRLWLNGAVEGRSF